MQQVRRSAITVAALVAVAVCGGALLAGCGQARARTCVTVPNSLPDGRTLQSGQRQTVAVGQVVFAVIGEPEIFSTGRYPRGFPWTTPRSGNRAVLARRAACPTERVTSLPETVTVFRAVATGQATLSAPLRPAWRSVPRRLRPPTPCRSLVIVR